MARWYLRRRGRFYRYGRYRSGRRYRRRYGSYSRKYVNGSSRSQVRLKVPVTFTPQFTATASGATTAFINPFYDAVPGSGSSVDSVRSALVSPLYRQYCSLYEEVKCVGMKVKLAISSSVGGSDIPSLQIYTAFDRRGSHSEMSTLPTFFEIKNYATFSAATAVNNTVAKLERSIYASDIMERAQWHDCTLVAHPSFSNGYRDSAYYTAGPNINFFCPVMYINMAIPQASVSQTVNTVCEVMYYFAFRNPKFGASAGSSKLTLDPIDAQPKPSIDDAGDMDNAAIDDAFGATASAASPSALQRAETRQRIRANIASSVGASKASIAPRIVRPPKNVQ